MFRNRFFRRILHQNLFEIDQVKLVYFLSLIVGLLSAIAAGLLKYSIHYTHKILTERITSVSGSYIMNSYLRLILGGIILGGLIYLFPPFYGEGYDTIMSLLQGNSDLIINNSIFSQFSGNFLVIILFMSGLVLLIEFSEE
jgi:H+/Cl- antiporter ClcA